jgi:hypothetical protein
MEPVSLRRLQHHHRRSGGSFHLNPPATGRRRPMSLTYTRLTAKQVQKTLGFLTISHGGPHCFRGLRTFDAGRDNASIQQARSQKKKICTHIYGVQVHSHGTPVISPEPGKPPSYMLEGGVPCVAKATTANLLATASFSPSSCY